MTEAHTESHTEPRADVQEKLLRATEPLIYAGGINATGMDLIVKTSGVARKSIYKHFGTKDLQPGHTLAQPRRVRP